VDAGVISKPAYSTSKQAIRLNTVAAWTVILGLGAGAVHEGKSVEFGTIALPSMVFLIAALHGIHRYTGSMDMRTIAGQALDGSQP
jgi:hypothetical protein